MAMEGEHGTTKATSSLIKSHPAPASPHENSIILSVLQLFSCEV